MMRRATILARILVPWIVGCCIAAGVQAQSDGFERRFPQSKATIEKILQDMQAATAGRLPVLDGFAISTSADHPLERYKRGYYQSKVEVSAAPSGGSIVRVSVQVTAWYADPVASKSGYQLLTSNGRLEADLLDQLGDELAANAPHAAPKPAPAAPAIAAAKPPKAETDATPAIAVAKPPRTPAAASPSSTAPTITEPTISAPVPRLPEVRSDSLAQGLAAQQQAGSQSGSKKPESLEKKDGGPLQTEVDSLEEILKNQSHPKNLVAVKKSGTPVVASASLTAKTLFLASAHDEFEMLDFNQYWVHVRISGISRGWIWRNSLEMPDSVPDGDAPASAASGSVAADLFHVTREEAAPFPGDWAPLRGKNVKIVSVEKIDEKRSLGPQLRLEFAKSVLDKDYAELAQKPQELAGVVVIFDAVDGGMLAATYETLQQWKAGKLSDAALWHQCFFDPPETFSATGASASQ